MLSEAFAQIKNLSTRSINGLEGYNMAAFSNFIVVGSQTRLYTVINSGGKRGWGLIQCFQQIFAKKHEIEKNEAFWGYSKPFLYVL